jgi:uncharacterized protein with ParB-like and HNH nuclease domain
MKNDIRILPNNERDDKGNLFSFLDLLKKENIGFKEYLIPIFQRNYSWDNDNLDDFKNSFDHFFDRIQKENNFPEFCDDKPFALVSSFYTNKAKAVFFGSIYVVLADNKNKLTLIDGQQRITTLLIFLLAQFFLLMKYKEAIKDAISQLEESNEEIINNTYIKLKSYLTRILFGNNNTNNDNRRENFTLKTDNLNDKEIWFELLSVILGKRTSFGDQNLDSFDNFGDWITSCQKKFKGRRNKDIAKKCVNSNIFNAFSYALNYFEDRIERPFNQERWSKTMFKGCDEENVKYLYLVATSTLFIFDICDYFDVGVFCLTSDKSEDISNLFETINSKGKQLSAFDLLKNEIYQILLINRGNGPIDENLFSQKMKELEDNIIDTYKTSEKSDYLVDLYKAVYINQIEEKEIMNVEKKGIFQRFRALLNSRSGIYYNNPYGFIEDTTNYFKVYDEMFPQKIKEYEVAEGDIFQIDNKLIFKFINILKYKSLKSIMVGAIIAARKSNCRNLIEEEANISQVFKRMAYVFTYNLKRTSKKANWHEVKFRKLIYKYLKQDQKDIKLLISELANLEKEKDDEFFRIIDDNKQFKKTINKIFERNEDGYNDFFEKHEIAKAILHDAYSQCKHDEKYRLLLTFEYELEHILPQSDITDDNSNGEIFQIGNLMLLTKKTNIANSNKNLEDKLKAMEENEKFTEIVKFDNKIYSNQKLDLRSIIGEKKDYIDNNDIMKRTNIFAEFLLSTFNYK